MLGILECKQLMCNVLVLVRAGRGSRSAVVCTKDAWLVFCWISWAPGHGMIEPKTIFGYRSGSGTQVPVHDNRNKDLKPCILLFRSITFFVHLWIRTNKCRHTLRTNIFRALPENHSQFPIQFLHRFK
jgi:hypothetical protein